MKKLLLTILAIFGLCVFAANGFAQPFTPTLAGDTYDSIPDGTPTPNDTAVVENIHDVFNLLLGTTHTKNEQVDSYMWTSGDIQWTDISPTADSTPLIFLSITAANNNTLGVYEIGGGPDIPVLGPFTGFQFSGDGSNANPFPAAISPLVPGTNFGWYLTTDDKLGNPDSVIRWDSDPTQNIYGADQIGLDHMVTYDLDALSGQSVWIKVGAAPAFQYTFLHPFLLAWEDLPLTGGLLGDEDYNDHIFLVDRVHPVPEPMSMMLFGSGLVGLVGTRLRRRVA